jgi:hypothetical protein
MAIEQVLAVIATSIVPQNAAVSPADIAVPPLVQNVVVPDYDFVAQQRLSGVRLKVAGNFTFNSQQTFDFGGHPNDARADNND